MSLVEKAIKGQLPSYQKMNKETLQWIIANNPLVGVMLHKYHFDYDIVDILKQFIPQTNWFLNQHTINGIHGLRHMLRVSALSIKISKDKHISEDQITNLLIAANLHDIRRNNDNSDDGHGERCSEWLLKNKDEILSKYKLQNNKLVNIELISKLIYYHDINLHDIEQTYSEDILLSILRLSDGLDRYRQPKIKWWPNFNYFNLHPSLEDQKFAYDLVVESEKKYLLGLSNTNSVILSIKEIIKAYD
jgi:hypothetical protein